MITKFCCEICHNCYNDAGKASWCEQLCRVQKRLLSRLSGGDWTPPLPLHQFHKWSSGDQRELARIVVSEIEIVLEAAGMGSEKVEKSSGHSGRL